MAGDARMTSPTADPLVGGDAFPRIQAAPAVAALGPRSLPELFAPAGGWECARAAVENGADAIYFGLEKFNARMRADNFTEADLPKLMDFLHRRGVKGYVTLNTLVFEDELDEAEQYLRTMIAAGVDAVIVQDAGICRLIRRLSPDFPIHASTQMTVTSLGGVEFARSAATWSCSRGNAPLERSRRSRRPRPICGVRAPSSIHRCLSRSSSTARSASPTPANA